MSHDEAIIDDIKNDLDLLDAEVLRSIREIIARSKRQTAIVRDKNDGSTSKSFDKAPFAPRRLEFVGENLTLEEFERLSLRERAMLKRRLKERNQQWLQEKFPALGAAWVMVIDGKVIASGKSLKNKPRPPQTVKISQRTGKFPFVFVNDKFITIEESASSWHKTVQTGDYYPTLPITFRSASNSVEMIGDFDSGASHTFVDYDFLLAQNIIRPAIGEEAETHLHLNERFDYFDKFVRIELPSTSGEPRSLETWVSCVQDWNLSPFVTINPNRTALIGRDILLELQPQVLLDFAKRLTEIVAAKKLSSARKKTVPKKKNATPKRRRA